MSASSRRGTKLKRHKLRKRDGDRCQLCGVRLGADASMDRLLPGRWGGLYTMDNLILAHAKCNSMRGSLMSVDEFRELAMYEIGVLYC